jgi:23S rRNA (uracil1939-C5)-methyltransferase
VLDAVPADTGDVLDLYAGVGLFALPLARRGHRVVAVEEHRAAVEAGRRSQRLNRLDERTCRFVAARTEEALARHAARPGTSARGRRDVVGPGSARTVVLDPPRSGCSNQVLRGIVRLQPDTIVYVSCEPSALARDLAALLEVGREESVSYRIDRVQPLDMFPYTPHVETVATLHRRTADQNVVNRRRAASRAETVSTRGARFRA